ncbi:MAG TPA: hypothetical protein VMF69_06625 [Gemmataceae bacterium]|nr:hypothetical protein [Gemmataceae bacterium]
MNEEEALIIATQFIKLHQIEHQGVERVFFVPLSAYDYVPPGLHACWAVHFKLPPVQEEEFDLLLPTERRIIVRVDVETKEASFTWQL